MFNWLIAWMMGLIGQVKMPRPATLLIDWLFAWSNLWCTRDSWATVWRRWVVSQLTVYPAVPSTRWPCTVRRSTSSSSTLTWWPRPTLSPQTSRTVMLSVSSTTPATLAHSSSALKHTWWVDASVNFTDLRYFYYCYCSSIYFYIFFDMPTFWLHSFILDMCTHCQNMSVVYTY